MNKSTFNKISIILILSILIFSSISIFVSAEMPAIHTLDIDESIAQVPNSEISQMIKNNYEDCIGATNEVDFGLFTYLDEGINSISSKYRSAHSQNFCLNMWKNAKDSREKTIAICACGHEVVDSVSHNLYVPKVIERTGLTNTLVHVFAEEYVNDKLSNPELDAKTKQAISNVAPYHKEFFRKNLVYIGADFNFDAVWDAYISEVTGNPKYSVGFRSFTAVPFSMHLILISLFLACMFLLALLIRKKNKSIFNKISIILILIPILIILLAYILFFTGKLWVFFQWASYPISQIMPTSGYEYYHNLEVQNLVTLLTKGPETAMAITPDPSGEQALLSAGAKGAGFRTIIEIILLMLIALFIWLNLRKRKKK